MRMLWLLSITEDGNVMVIRTFCLALSLVVAVPINSLQ
jgi:hypothetical protein